MMALGHMPTYGCEHLTKECLTKIEEFYRNSSRSSSKTTIDPDFVQYTCLSCPTATTATGNFSTLDKHFSKTKHDLAFGLSGKSIYCGKCNDLVYEPSIVFKGNPALHLFDVQNGSASNKRRKLSQPSEEDEAYLSQNTTARPCGREGVRGLFNLGETCYMNAVLQMMVHNPLLSSYFLGMGHPVHTCPISKEPEPSATANNDAKTNGKKSAGGESDESEDEQMNGNGEEKEEKEQKTCVACGMTELFSDSSLVDQTLPAHAVNLLFASWKNIPHMSGKSQQDAQEWFMIIVDKLHEAVTNPLVTAANSHSHSSNSVNGLLQDSTSNTNSTKHKDKQVGKHCPCFFHKVFYGRFHSDITCETCHHVITTEEEYSSLSLDFKKQAKKKKKEAKEKDSTSTPSKSDTKTSKAQAAAAASAAAAAAPPPHLYECLKAYTAPESMSADNYTCPSCKAPCAATKRLRIRKLPAILCVHVKRFGMKKIGGQISNHPEKYEGKLDFPLVLDMGAYTAVPKSSTTNGHSGSGSGSGSSGASSNNKKGSKADKPASTTAAGANDDEEMMDAADLEKGKYIYDLDSVVVHQGEHAHTGHYFAFCRQGGKWFRFDDEIVSATTTEDVLRQEAYLLFYGLRDII